MKNYLTITGAALAPPDAHYSFYNPTEEGVSLAFNLKQDHPPN